MSCRPRPALALALASAAALGCRREERRFQELPAYAGRAIGEPRAQRPVEGRVPLGASAMPPGGAPPGPGPYDDNAWAISQGQKFYVWFNCNGCHALGGGAIGPPLMDAGWVYGGEPADIYASIVGGRPNGMPAFGGKIADHQVWQIVAYVRSLSGMASASARASRPDGLAAKPPENLQPPEPPRQEVRP